MGEGINEYFLARKLSELKFSNSPGPCACIHLLLVSIVRSFTLQHVYTRKGTSKRFVVVHYQVSKYIYKFLKFSYFLTGGKDLESLAEDYFGTRPVEEDDDQLDDYGSDSSDETNQEIDSDDHFDFPNCDRSERSKVQAFEPKKCECALRDNGDSCSSTIKIEVIFDCRNNLAVLSSTELNLVILAMIHCAINCDHVSDSGGAETMRQRTRMPFHFHSHRVCLKTFLFIHRLHKTRFYSCAKHYRLSGLYMHTYTYFMYAPNSQYSSRASTFEKIS